jgi:DNA-binding MarR family transcriptional regulator
MSTSTAVPVQEIADETSKAIRALRAAAAHVERTMARALEPHGVTTAQFAALQVLDEARAESLGCSELGQRLAGPAPDVTRLLDRLDAAGLVSRDRSESDRRIVHTRITPAGQQLVQTALPSVHEAEERALAGLDPANRAELTALLAGIQKNCPGQG